MATAGPSNADILGHSRTVWDAKKRQKKEQVQQVVFDEDARTDFLTGFHKRKVAKKQEKVSRAKERDHLEQLRERTEKRQELRERAIANAQQVESALGGHVLIDAAGIGVEQPAAKEEEEAYSGDEQYATVTVIEDFDPSADLLPQPRPPRVIASGREGSDAKAKPPPKPALAKVRDVANKKDKEKKFRYETKAGRKTAKTKERKRRNERGGMNEKNGQTERRGKKERSGKKGKVQRG